MYINMHITRSLLTEVFHNLTILNLLKDFKEKKKPIWLYLAIWVSVSGNVGTLAHNARWKLKKKSHMSHMELLLGG